MKTIIKKHLPTFMLTVLFYAMVACGGKSNIIGGGITDIFRATRSVVVQVVPVTGLTHRATTSNMALFAGATTPSLTAQSFNGFCHTTPDVEAKFIVYGIGRFDNSNCGNGYADFTNQGAPVIDDGTLTTLYAIGKGGSTDQSGKVEVFVNGTLIPLTCTIGTKTKCKVTGSIPVLDNDGVSARMNVLAGDHFQDVQIIIVKE